MLSPRKGALGRATYERHRPEQTLLYQLVEKHYPALVEQLDAQEKYLPEHVRREFDAYLKCGRLEHGFLRVRCDTCHFERLVAFSCKKRGFCPILFLDGVYIYRNNRPLHLLRRYIARLSLSSTGKVVYTLKTPYRDGTTQAAFDPVDFIARLAALVPKPRVNLTRYHGVLAPNHNWRGLVTPAKRGRGVKSFSNAEVRTSTERHAARACPASSGMTWAQRLKRVFSIDIEVCGRCGGSVRVIACIKDQDTIDRILTHLREKEQNIPNRPLLVPPTRAPPGTLPLFAGRDSSPARKEASENRMA